MRCHRAERSDLRHRPTGDVHAAGTQVSADVVGARLGDEAEIERAGRINGTGLPVRRSARAHVDLLVSERQGHATLTENLAPHAKNPHVPLGGGVDIATVEDHVVYSVDIQRPQLAAHSLACSSSSWRNRESSPGTI